MSEEPNREIPERARLEAEYERRRPAYGSVLEDMERLVRDRLEAASIHPTIKGRVKGFESWFKKRSRLIRKARTEGSAPVFLTDLVGIRIVCPFLGDIARAERVIGEHFTIVETERKGADRSFREFGYESIHLLVEFPREIEMARPGLDVRVCEIQLRTILQEAWAEVEHELVYKAEFAPFDEPMKRKLAALNANLSLSDIIFQEIREYQRRLSRELERRRDSFNGLIEESMDEPFLAILDAEDGTAPEQRGSEGEDDNSKSLDDLLLEALYAHNRKDFPRAIAIYGEILARHPPREAATVVHKHRGMAWFSQGCYAEAIGDFGQVLSFDAGCYRAAYFSGVAHCVLGEYERAMELFNRSLAAEPCQFWCLVRRAQAWWHLGDFPRCVADCEAALTLKPGHQLADSLRKRGLGRLTLDREGSEQS